MRLRGLVIVLWLTALAATVTLAAGGTPPERPIDLNTATATELMQLPRVGARTAARILAFRQEHGPFRRIEEVMGVKGIGEKQFRKLAPHLRVGPAPDPEGQGA